MKAEHLSEALGELSEDLVEEAAAAQKKPRRPAWVKWVAAAACLALVAAIAMPSLLPREQKLPDQQETPLGEGKTPIMHAPELPDSARLLAAAAYPEMPKYPDFMNDTADYTLQLDAWCQAQEELYAQVKDFVLPESFLQFYSRTSQEFLQTEENAVYSPLNVYMALCMLAELTEGNSRAQILELLDVESIEEVRENATAFWISNYSDDGLLTTVLGNSLWLRDDLGYEEDTMQTLAEIYYASSYAGTMGSEEFDRLLRDWINDQTGGLLQEQAEGLSFDVDTVMALASTVYFKGRWADRFSEHETKPRTFYALEEEQTVDFMNKTEHDRVYWGEGYTACKQYMNGEAAMWLILPDEGISPQELLAQAELYEMTSAKEGWENSKTVELTVSVPKFDVSGSMELSDGLKKLGVTDVFDPMLSDFSPMTKELDEIVLSKAEHAARVKIDEEGCEAAAFTVMMTEGTGAFMDTERVELVFDRPFLFVIAGKSGQPLFIGTVYEP